MMLAIWTGMYAEKPLDEALEILNGHGWNAFEVSTEHLVTIETSNETKRLIDAACHVTADLGLVTPQSHGLLQADVASPDVERRSTDIERIEKHIDISSRLGVKVVVLHPGGKRAAETRSERERITRDNVEAFRRLGDFAGERNMQIGLENLMRRGVTTAYEMLDLLAAIDRPNIGVTLDTSHANAMGLDIPTMINELGSDLIATHISDNDGSGDQHKIPGHGLVDWPPVSSSLSETGYEGLLNFEIPGERHGNYDLRALHSRHACNVARWMAGVTS
jgi:sugar phosphate isomerase/epimerase